MSLYKNNKATKEKNNGKDEVIKSAKGKESFGWGD